VIAAGATDIGENYIQEAAAKIAAIGRSVRWHMIGHLQRNKALRAAELFDCVHTVANLALAQRLGRAVAERGGRLPVLIEVNIGGEPQKSGVAVEAAADLAVQVRRIEALRLQGLMTIPPRVEHAEAVRAYFAALRRLGERLAGVFDTATGAPELSMGMSGDFEVAVEEGATMVRIGRALFGERG